MCAESLRMDIPVQCSLWEGLEHKYLMFLHSTIYCFRKLLFWTGWLNKFLSIQGKGRYFSRYSRNPLHETSAQPSLSIIDIPVFDLEWYHLYVVMAHFWCHTYSVFWQLTDEHSWMVLLSLHFLWSRKCSKEAWMADLPFSWVNAPAVSDLTKM